MIYIISPTVDDRFSVFHPAQGWNYIILINETPVNILLSSRRRCNQAKYDKLIKAEFLKPSNF